MSEDFHHTTPIQIRFADLDAMNHVNNANYLTYTESARISYFTDVFKRGMKDSPGFILAKATVDFLVPILITDQIQVRTRCSRIGTKSFDLEYVIEKTNSASAEVVAKAHTVLVAFDYSSQKSIAIPDDWKKKIENFEGKTF